MQKKRKKTGPKLLSPYTQEIETLIKNTYLQLSHMKTQGVSSSILSAVRAGVADQIAGIAKRPFDGSSIHSIEKRFIETIGQSGSHGLSQLLSSNDEYRKTVIVNGQKHYRKYFATVKFGGQSLNSE